MFLERWMPWVPRVPWVGFPSANAPGGGWAFCAFLGVTWPRCLSWFPTFLENTVFWRKNVFFVFFWKIYTCTRKKMAKIDKIMEKSMIILIWMFPKIGVPPNHPLKNMVFHFKPSILRVFPYFWKHPYCWNRQLQGVKSFQCLRCFQRGGPGNSLSVWMPRGFWTEDFFE